MKIVIKDTEKELFQDLKSSWVNSTNDRCVYLKSSKFETHKDEWFPVLLEILKTHFFDEVSKVYVCHDGDLFLISRTFTEKQLNNFLNHLKPQLSPAFSSQGLATIFEIKVDWPKLRIISEKKLENLATLKASSIQKKQEELKHVSRNQTLDSLDISLINSLSKRRNSRDNPVIMVVEDDLFTQKLIKNTLNSYQDVAITGDGQGAIMAYVNKAPDILFLDIGLPDIDGHDVLKKLFEIDPDAYIVMFSGNGYKENILKALQLGAKGFLGKPFTKDKMYEYIKKSPFIQAKNA